MDFRVFLAPRSGSRMIPFRENPAVSFFLLRRVDLLWLSAVASGRASRE